MLITKPKNNRYVLHNVDNATYVKSAIGYSNAKKYGLRGIYSYLTGIGLWGVAKEALKGTFIQYGKRRLAIVVVDIGIWVRAPAVAVLTNSTKIVNITKTVYSLVCWAGEASEDLSNVSFILFDIVVFGQPIPLGEPNRFNVWSNFTDISIE